MRIGTASVRCPTLRRGRVERQMNFENIRFVSHGNFATIDVLEEHRVGSELCETRQRSKSRIVVGT
jgi:hypothetical protein